MRKIDYDRHLVTKKHNNDKIKVKYTCDNCSKCYSYREGLYKHKIICGIKTNNDNNNEQIKFSNQLIMKILKDNEEMKKIIIEQTQQQKQIMEMLPKMCIGNIITNTTNNIKQKFNLNFFLNEQCKDAINMCDFVKSLNITFDDLNVTRDKSLEDSVGSIFLRGLKELDVFKRPIHCTDVKRDVMYIKEEDNWKKDEGNEKLKNSISEVSRKQVKTLKELKDSDPEIKTNENKRDEFILTMNHVCTPIPDSGEKRIIKTISKEVIVA
jgi:hypothetical protein